MLTWVSLGLTKSSFPTEVTRAFSQLSSCEQQNLFFPSCLCQGSVHSQCSFGWFNQALSLGTFSGFTISNVILLLCHVWQSLKKMWVKTTLSCYTSGCCKYVFSIATFGQLFFVTLMVVLLFLAKTVLQVVFWFYFLFSSPRQE